MNTPAEFDDIRPYLPEELPAAFENLLSDPQFLAVANMVLPGLNRDELRKVLLSCRDNLDFQKKVIYGIVKEILSKCCTGYGMDAAAITDKDCNYTFVSNHRDIVLDAAILCILLLDNGFPNTVEIAIGDNLLVYPWIKNLVRVNKSFIVRRSPGMREMLRCSKQLSEYMHYAINEKHESIWIAQREGRAKNSDDRTQQSLLKMMAMGGEGTAQERLKQLHIVPVSISYEFDPCDFLKAKEFQQKRDDAYFKKSREDDLLNMKTGIFGYKGRVHYALSPCIDNWIEGESELPKAEFFEKLAAHIDHNIHKGYKIFENYYIAADMLEKDNRFSAHYTDEEKVRFETYLAGQIEKINLKDKDMPFLRERILEMYANPLFNHLKALQ